MKTQPNQSATERVDVLIIGAGPSGAVVANEMARNGFSVVCLEQGRWFNNAEFPGDKQEWELLSQQQWSHDPNIRGNAEDYPLSLPGSDLHPVMIAGVGGSSILYGGHWMRLLPSDFRMHSLDGVADDWPITYDELAPFYDKIDRAIGVSGVAGDPMYPPGMELPLPPHPIGKVGRRAAAGMNKLGWHWWPSPNAIASQRLGELARCVRFGTCETGCPEGAKASFDITHWPAAIKHGAQLRTHSRVRKITVDQRGRADGAIYFDANGVEHEQKARLVVLAANGIGTPRLLLLSAHAGAPDGLANSSGMVGKRLMLHPNGEVTGIYDEDMQSWLGPAGQAIHSLEFYETDVSRGFVGGAKWQVMPTGGPLRALSLHDREPWENQWGSAVHDRMRETVGRSLQWAINSQDMPEDTNTVTLDDTVTDSSGIPAPKVFYKISENTRRLMSFNLDRVEEAHQAAGAIKTIRTDLWPDQPGHLLGTAKMGNDPATSVVDKWGLAHDVPNLAIVDGSTMPTSGAVNPTATITAMALRTAEYLVANARWQEIAE
ncbi:GMC family oxidoreductase [Mycobacterium sp. NAZ190054]|uniref:GMC family oxidoreductase n=1 Tax=Mycobacterium sp. NAZ190054 TaxID=1747766 RepID=UPI0007964D55|nr:GMC family oxidoreductase [Mycobacterium sp. NAZ190054]KWX64530.1 glucose dehydrogenase [Mycobacterium sp. NAZ190054]